jgi:threonine dehydrogenase-like Zn-dependent dehydrogenase
MATALLKDLTVRVGLVDVERFLPQLFSLVRAGRFSLASLITHRFPFEQAPEAYRLFASRAQGCLKVWLSHS